MLNQQKKTMNEYPMLSECLFIRCFSKKQYMDEFLSGKRLRMGSAESYWKVENGFQGDPYECAVIPPDNSLKWNLWGGDDHPKVMICDEADFSIGVDAFLYCLFAIPKAFFSIRNGELYIDEESPYHKDFFHFLDEFLGSRERVFVCAFDAGSFMTRISERLQEKGLDSISGFVTYNDRTIEERVSLFLEKRIEDIVFTKQQKYQYQREFRVAVKSRMDVDHIEIDGVSMDDIVLLSGEYNSAK